MITQIGTCPYCGEIYLAGYLGEDGPHIRYHKRMRDDYVSEFTFKGGRVFK